MRQVIIFLVSLVALIGSVTAALATASQQAYNLRGYEDPTLAEALPYKVPRLGVNADLFQYEPSERVEHLQSMQDAGFHWIRQQVSWADIETAPGQYSWEAWDNLIEQVSTVPPLKLIVVFYADVPAWASSDPNSPTAPPDDPAVMADWVGAFASRYGQHIDHYQIWDEPNLREAWGGRDPQPAAYAALLQASYDAVHANDAHAHVITAALAPTTETGPHNFDEQIFLSRLYDLGAADFMDAVAAKPYGFDHSPDDRQVEQSHLNVSRVIRLREEMVLRGDGHKAIWASHWGWNSLPNDWSGLPSIWGQTAPDEQITYTLRTLERAEREWPWMAGMTLHHWQPDTTPDDPQWGFSLVDQQNVPKPLLQALQGYAQALPNTARNGLYPPDNAYTTYSGVWTFGELGADVGWLSDSRLQFQFSGANVALRLRQGDFVGYLYPTVDGQPANALPQDNVGNSYIVLTSPTRDIEPALVTVASGLNPNETHTLQAVVDRGWDQWVLMGYAVSDGDLTAPYQRQIQLAWFTAAVASLAVATTGYRLPWGAALKRTQRITRLTTTTYHLLIGVIASLLLMLGMLLTWNGATISLFRRDAVSLLLSLITAGLIYVEPGIIITILAALLLFWVFYHRQDIGLVLVLLWTPFFLFPVQLYLYAFPMAEVMILILFPAWLLRTLIDQAPSRRFLPNFRGLTAIDIGLFGYLAVGIISLTWTSYLDPALTELRVMVIEPLLFYIVLRNLKQPHLHVQRLIDVWIFTGLLAALISVAMYFAGEAIITAEGGALRLAGIYGSPNNLALFLGRVFPFAVIYSVMQRGPRRYLGGVTLILLLPTFLLTQSAAALFIGIPITSAVLAIMILRRRAMMPIIGIAGLSAAAFAFLLQFPRFSRLLDFSEGTNFFRLRVWQSAINIIRDYPVTGLGLDQFLYAFRGAYILPDAWQEPELSHPHNILLDFWTRLGFLGVLVLIVLQVSFWRLVLRLYRQKNLTASAQGIVIGAAGAMTYTLAHGMVDNSVFVNDLALAFVFILALPQLIRRITNRETT